MLAEVALSRVEQAEEVWLPQVRVRLISPRERAQWDHLITEHHYLHNATLVGEVLRYVAVGPDERWVGLLGWASPALRMRPRERWIGWSEAQREARLRLVAQNSRFLILTERGRVPNLASRLLALCTARLAADWEAVHGHPVLIAETFVDPERFPGTCYKAAGWEALGPTGGYQRNYRDFYTDLEHPKELWVRPLRCEARDWLRAAQLPAPLAAQLPAAPPRCEYKCTQLDSLWQRCHDRLTDPRARRGKRHLQACLLAIAALATIAGERGPKGFAAFARELSTAQRRHLRCHVNRRTGELEVPSEPTFRRLFKRLPQGELTAVLADWMAQYDPHPLTAVAVDGKTLKGSRQRDGRPVHLMSAVAHSSQRLLNQLPIDQKSNEIPSFAPLLAPLPLKDAVVTADAEHCQRAHAHFLVHDKQADYVFIAKDNQPGLCAQAEAKLPGAVPPSG